MPVYPTEITSQPADSGEVRRSRLLLVDDEPLILETIGLFLEDEGYEVTLADGGARALDEVAARDYDVVVTDLSMPHTDGFEVMAAVRSRQPETPVIVLTGLGTLDNAVKAIQHGAYDFVTKPVQDLTVFHLIIKRAIEKRDMLLTRKAHLAQIERQNQDHLQDLEAARRIQSSLIHRDFGPATRYLRITSRYLPAYNIGGDFYDIFHLPPKYVAFYMADVAGHGVSAAMVTAIAKQTLTNIVGKFSERVGSEGPSPRDILLKFNQEMLAQSFERDGIPMYLTVFLGVYDPARGLVRYTNGGHAPVPRHLGAAGTLKTLYLEGNPLGLFENPVLFEDVAPLGPGDRIFICTDGLTEAMGPQAEPYGPERLDDRLSGLTVLDSENLADRVVEDVLAYCRPAPPRDDISVLIISPA
ncbi:MAG: SpoIIE family protein phosphatase [Thermodesulfobacteriota bacterium]